jgi:hypothetical protein
MWQASAGAVYQTWVDSLHHSTSRLRVRGHPMEQYLRPH